MQLLSVEIGHVEAGSKMYKIFHAFCSLYGPVGQGLPTQVSFSDSVLSLLQNRDSEAGSLSKA